ncbi:MAG TPA: CsbD family protein [Permianibacter sp.]|nr:CsbD family protein [Permianibacter sp.]
MNWNMIEGNWRLYRGELRTHWRMLSDESLDTVSGKRPRLAMLLQRLYGISADEAERQINAFLDEVTTMPRYHSDRNHGERGHPKRA